MQTINDFNITMKTNSHCARGYNIKTYRQRNRNC